MTAKACFMFSCRSFAAQSIFVLLCWCALPLAHAALPVPINRPVIDASELGVYHELLPDATKPTVSWHVFARCTRNIANDVFLTAFIVREHDNTTMGQLGFPQDAPHGFVQLGDGATWKPLNTTPVLSVALHPTHIKAGPLQHSGTYTLAIADAAHPMKLDSCIQNATLEEHNMSDNPNYYIVYAGLQGLPLRLATQVLKVHALHYRTRGFSGIRLYMAASNVNMLLRDGSLNSTLDEGFLQIVSWEYFPSLMSHPRYLHAIAKHHAALATIGRASWLFFPGLDEMIMPGDACGSINTVRKTCAAGNSSVLMPVYNAVCRTCKIYMALERALWMSSFSFQHIMQSYEQITNILDKDTGFIGFQLGGDPTKAYPWLWSSSRVWYKQAVWFEPLIRIEDALTMWADNNPPGELPNRKCLFVLRFPNLLFHDDVMRLDKVYEWIDFPTHCKA